MRLPVIAFVAALGCVYAAPAGAHHEAIFGPHSSLVLSGDSYLTAQVFTSRTGPAGNRTRETTTVLSGGFSPRGGPLSVAAVVPFSVISHQGHSRIGAENSVVGARYRVDLPGLERTWSLADSYALAVGGIELPTGTVDRPFGDGALAMVTAGLFSVERGAWSAIGYGFFHRYGVYHDIRDSGHMFLGGGLAWTPLDREDEGRLFSLQLGLSRETTFDEEVSGIARPGSGGSAVVLYPTAMAAAGRHLLLFVTTALSVADDWQNPDEHEKLRVGVGAIVKLSR